MSTHALAAPRRRPRTRSAAKPALARRQPAASAGYVAALAFAALVVVNPLQVAILLAMTVILLAASGRLRASLPYVRVALAVGLFLAVLNPFFSHGGLTVLWEADFGAVEIRLTLEGLSTASRPPCVSRRSSWPSRSSTWRSTPTTSSGF